MVKSQKEVILEHIQKQKGKKLPEAVLDKITLKPGERSTLGKMITSQEQADAFMARLLELDKKSK